MNSMVRQNAIVVLAWLNSANGPDVTMSAVAGGRQVAPEFALSRLFENGLAGALRFVPWLDGSARPNDPICAYAAITGASATSGFVLHPAPEDAARLANELQTLAKELIGRDVPGLLATSPFPAQRDHLELAIFEGAARRDGRDVGLTDGEFAVLSFIAMNKDAMGRDRVCDWLWPERDMESSAGLLKLYVHKIRSKFATNAVIETHRNGYRIGVDVDVDTRHLEAVAQTGSAGAGALRPADRDRLQRAFDAFTERRYDRLAYLEHYVDLERRLVTLGVELGRLLVRDALLRTDGLRALTLAEHLTAIEPYDEVSADLYIRAQLQLGRHDAASRYFRGFCRMLHDELGLPPPQRLASLFHGLTVETT